MRASDLPLQSQFPKMDLTSLYCLGITVQEYARHLATNILTQKLASENTPQLNTLFTPEEIQSRSITAAIENYKQKKPVKHATSVVINPRPDIRQELSSHARSIKYHQNDPFHVDTVSGDTYYQKMLRSTDWENVLRKDKDPEAAAAAAQLRREKDAKRQARKLEKSLEKEEKKKRKLDDDPLHIPPSAIPVNQEKYLPLSPPADVFDKASASSKSKSKSKKTTSSSQKKRKNVTESFF